MSNFTRSEWKRCKTTLNYTRSECSLCKTTLEASVIFQIMEQIETPPEETDADKIPTISVKQYTRNELRRSKLHSKRVGKIETTLETSEEDDF